MQTWDHEQPTPRAVDRRQLFLPCIRSNFEHAVASKAIELRALLVVHASESQTVERVLQTQQAHIFPQKIGRCSIAHFVSITMCAVFPVGNHLLLRTRSLNFMSNRSNSHGRGGVVSIFWKLNSKGESAYLRGSMA